MIEYKTGSIFDSTCQTLVNPVNCVGVGGAGLALEFKQRFPDMFKRYKQDCAKGYVEVGDVYLYTDVCAKQILLFPTKWHWNGKSHVEFIKPGLKSFLTWFDPIHGEDLPITSIAFPALGCGLGGLQWEDVKPVMEQYLSGLEIPVEIYLPKKEG